MIHPRQIIRLLKIQGVLLRHGLDDVVVATHLFRPLGWLRYLATRLLRRAPADQPLGQRLRLALVELGPVFVKFGQALSTRRDLLPREVADELARLQDRVPPFDGDVARELAEKALGQPVETAFARFDEQALAAASIAQVHAAELHDGQEVVVKILRPGMRRLIQRDVEVLYALARLAERYWKESRRLRPVEVVTEYEKTILDELDLMREAANAAQLRRNFTGSDLLYVPDVHWDLCRGNVLVLERIRGIPIGDTDALRAAGTDMRRLAENGVEVFFTQVFRHNFFHADMHPGNIFVDVTDPKKPRYIAVDFGIVGSLSPRDQHYLAGNFLAFFERDYFKVARLHIDSGWVPAGTRVDEFESAIRTVCEPIFNRPLKDISFGLFLLRLFQTARRFDMPIQPQLVLLQKTLLSIEGLGRQLYPDLDLWQTAHPILKEWMADRVSGRAVLASLRDQLPEMGESLKDLPQLANSLMHQVADGQVRVEFPQPGIDRLRDEIREADRRRYVALASGCGVLGGILWLGLQIAPVWPGWVLAAAGCSVLWYARPRRADG